MERTHPICEACHQPITGSMTTLFNAKQESHYHPSCWHHRQEEKVIMGFNEKEQHFIMVEAVDEMGKWMEHITLAISQVSGLNVTQMKQATDHLVAIRRILGTTSTTAPDDRASAWPEGEGK